MNADKNVKRSLILEMIGYYKIFSTRWKEKHDPFSNSKVTALINPLSLVLTKLMVAVTDHLKLWWRSRSEVKIFFNRIFDLEPIALFWGKHWNSHKIWSLILWQRLKRNSYNWSLRRKRMMKIHVVAKALMFLFFRSKDTKVC